MNEADKAGQTPAAAGRGPRRPRRWLPYAGAIVVLGAIALALRPQYPPVETTLVRSGPLRVTIDEEGRTRIRHRYVVSAPVAGQMRRIDLRAGDEVQGGKTVIAVIEPARPAMLDQRLWTGAVARRDSAEASLGKARAARTFAAAELKRFEKLFSDQTVSPQELEAAQMREATAAKEEAAAGGTLREAEAELARFNPAPGPSGATAPETVEVLAPVDGRVLKVIEENSRVVPAGAPLVEIGDPRDLEAVVEVLSRDGATIAPGANVEFEQWGGEGPLTGRVRLVEPAAFTKVSALGVEEQRVNVVADLTTPPAQRTGVGDSFRVEAKIIVWEDAQALKVPSGALFRLRDEWAAFAVVEGRAELRKVRVGRAGAVETQILSGLKSGDHVILYPGSRITAGQRVRVANLE